MNILIKLNRFVNGQLKDVGLLDKSNSRLMVKECDIFIKWVSNAGNWLDIVADGNRIVALGANRYVCAPTFYHPIINETELNSILMTNRVGFNILLVFRIFQLRHKRLGLDIVHGLSNFDWMHQIWSLHSNGDSILNFELKGHIFEVSY